MAFSSASRIPVRGNLRIEQVCPFMNDLVSMHSSLSVTESNCSSSEPPPQ